MSICFAVLLWTRARQSLSIHGGSTGYYASVMWGRNFPNSFSSVNLAINGGNIRWISVFHLKTNLQNKFIEKIEIIKP